MKKTLIGSLISIVILGSCLKSHDNQTTCDPNYDPCGVVAPTTEVMALENYLFSNGITDATKHCSGMYYKIDSAGTGKIPTLCSYVYVKYKGQLTNNTVFDSTTVNPAVFNLSSLIAGFKNGVPLIKEGGGIHLYVPPSLAYGNKQNGTIPPNSILIFQVSLVAVQ
jgi:FKBP-type peptidyl-prolyl cis-trans isomerase FkpA